MSTSTLVRIPAGNVTVEGMLELPEGAAGLVLFAHGSGSSRHSPRNNTVAGVLRQAGVGTLLMDLLTPEEDRDYARRFDIGLLTQRLLDAVRWVRVQAPTRALPLGFLAPVPAPRLHSRPRLNWAAKSARWSRAAAVPISPASRRCCG
ncbi:dienelactone hydrolase family protein [Thiobacillus sp.]